MLSSPSFYNTFVPGRYRDGVPVRLPVHRVMLSSPSFYNAFVPGRYQDGTRTVPVRFPVLQGDALES